MRRWLPWLACVLALLLGGYYQRLAREFPFDFVWDMDISATQDVLLLNSGLPPAHLDHPKYVMALAQAAEAGLLQRLGSLTTARLTDLAESPQPMLGLAELDGRLRQAHAAMSWLLVLLLAGLIWQLFPQAPWLAVLALPLFGLQAGPLYNALAMRSELYSVLLLALGLGLMLHLWRPGRRPSVRTQTLTMLGLGLLAGLSLLNKIQALGLWPLLPIFSFACYLRWQPAEPQPRLRSGLVLGLSLLLFAGLALGALWTPALPGRTVAVVSWPEILHQLPASLGRLKIQAFWLLLLGSGAGAWLLSRRIGQRWAHALSLYPLFVAGMLLAMALPVFALLGHRHGLLLGWQYTATLLHAVVWLDGSLLNQGGSAAATMQFEWLRRPDLLMLPLASGLLLALLAWQQPERRREYAAWAAVIGACLLCFVLGNRPLLRDSLWFEVWGSWAGVLGMGLLSEHLGHSRPGLRWLPGLALAGLALNSWQLSGREREAVYLYHGFFGYDGAPYDFFLTKSVYLHGDNPYARIFDRAFEENPQRVGRAISQARDWETLAARLRQPVLNATVPLSAAGMLQEGFPAWQADGQWARFTAVPENLRQALFVPVHRITPAARSRLYLTELDSDQPNARLLAPARVLTLVPPFNQTLLLALPAAVFPGGAATLQVTAAGSQVDYRVWRLNQPLQLDLHKLMAAGVPPLLIYFSANVQPPEAELWSDELTRRLQPD